MPATTTATEAPTTLSEHEAARKIGALVGTLRTWRIKGKLAPGLVKETPSLAPGGRPKIEYDAAWVADYVNPDAETPRDIFAGDDIEAAEAE